MSELDNYLASKRSAFNNKRMYTLMCDFMLVEKWASFHALHILFGNPNKTTTRRFLDRMCEFGLLNKENIATDGNRRGYLVYLTTRHGFSYMSDEGLAHKVNVVKKSSIAVSTLIHSIDLQTLHAVCVSKGYESWEKPDFQYRKKGVHYSDALALKDGEHVAFELERYLKTPARYDVLFSHYANEIYKKKLSRVYYVCPEIKVAKKIKDYFKSIDVVRCDDKTFKTNDGLFNMFKFVDYEYFGF